MEKWRRKVNERMKGKKNKGEETVEKKWKKWRWRNINERMKGRKH